MGYQAATEHSFSSSPPLFTPQCPVAFFFVLFRSEPTAPHMKPVIPRQRSNIEITTPQGLEHSALLPLCACHLFLFVFQFVHTCTSRCLRKWENPKILNGNWPGGSLLIAPATSKERRGNRVKVTEYKTNTKQTSATAGSRVLILPFNPQTASELLFKDVFKSLNHL